MLPDRKDSADLMGMGPLGEEEEVGRTCLPLRPLRVPHPGPKLSWGLVATAAAAAAILCVAGLVMSSCLLMSSGHYTWTRNPPA